jgi:hypothetical protein
MASQAKGVLEVDHLEAVPDRGYFNSTEILACEQADITVTLPKPMTSGAKADSRFGKQHFVYLPAEDRRDRPFYSRLTPPHDLQKVQEGGDAARGAFWPRRRFAPGPEQLPYMVAPPGKLCGPLLRA